MNICVRRLKAGKIKIVPGIKRFTCGRVELVNGENLEIDSVILATGYCSNVPSWLKSGFEFLGISVVEVIQDLLLGISLPMVTASFAVEDGEVLNGGLAQTIPPSFKQGVDLGTLKTQLYLWKVYDDQGAVKSTLDAAKPDSSGRRSRVNCVDRRWCAALTERIETSVASETEE
ncbi:hypothetical protein LguiA_030364 [Lonicera macranthoides]